MKFSGGDGGSGYFINGCQLRLVNSCKDLGVTIDSSLRFHSHINSIVCKASGLANQLLRATVCRDAEFMVRLFVSHIRPIMDYCSTVWNLGFAEDIRKLEGVQRRWTKQVAGMNNISYDSRLKLLGLYSVRGRLFRGDLIKLWKVFHSETDVGLVQMFDRQFHGSTRGHSLKLSFSRGIIESRRRFLTARCVSTWNGLPTEAVEQATLESFKTLDAGFCDDFYAVT